MRISTDYTAIAGLTSLFGTAYENSALTGSQSTSDGFGTSSILSIGDESESESDTLLFDYTSILSSVYQPQTTAAATQYVSEEQAAAEEESIKIANALRIDGRFDEARSVLDDVLSQNPANAVAVQGLGAIELDLGNYEKAESYFRKADYLAPAYGFSSDADNAQTLQRDDEYVLERARQLTANPDTQEDGVRLLTSLTNRSPDNAVARTLLAENLILTGDATNGLAQYQAAISTADENELRVIESQLESLLDVAPEAAYLHNLLGQTQLGLGKSELAAASLALATQLSDGDSLYQKDEALAKVALGRESLAAGDIVGALSYFASAKTLDPTSDEVSIAMAEGYVAKAEQKTRLGDPTAAIEAYQKAQKELGTIENDDLRASIADGFYRAGRTLERRRISAGDEIGDEVIAFQAAYDLDPENATYKRKLAETRSAIGDEYLAEGDFRNAAYAYKQALELDEYNDDYETAAISAFMAWGNERSEAHDHTLAITAFQEAYDLDNDNEDAKFSLAEAFNTRGLFYRRLGEDFYSDAAEDFLEALDLYPDNSDYQDNYDSVI